LVRFLNVIELIRGFWNLAREAMEHNFWPGVTVNSEKALKYLLDFLKSQASKLKLDIKDYNLDAYVHIVESLVENELARYDITNALKVLWKKCRGKFEIEGSETLALECYSALTIVLKNLSEYLKVPIAAEWQESR